MRLLADEGLDSRVVEALQAAGHDVMAVAFVARGARDSEVLALAHREGGALLTEDRDFGQLVYASGRQDSVGVLYVPCPERDRPMLASRIVSLVDRLGPTMHASFVVWTPNRCRVRRYDPR